MKKNTKNFYGVDIRYEVRTHKYVGEDYYLNSWSKIRRYIRKIWNRNEKKYKKCDTYSEWEKYVKSNLQIRILNYEDFICWARMHLRNSQKWLEGVKCVLIPIYIAMISVCQILSSVTAAEFNFIFLLSLLVLILCFSVKILVGAQDQVNFWVDYISIAQKAKKDECKDK